MLRKNSWILCHTIEHKWMNHIVGNSLFCYNTLREESSQTNVILQYKLLAAI